MCVVLRICVAGNDVVDSQDQDAVGLLEAGLRLMPLRWLVLISQAERNG